MSDNGVNNNAMIDKAMIECMNLTKKYDEFKALDSLDLNVLKGEIFAFVGPNGAGKTTTMNILVGLIAPTSGEAIISGYNIIKNPIEVKKVIGFLPENVSLYPRLSARQNVRYISDLNGGFAEGKIDEMLDLVGLGKVKDKKAGEFSKGMKQRLGVACVLVKEPGVLFLDEPTSGLDPTGKLEFQDLMKNLGEAGMTIFYSSHILGEVKDIADRVGILHQGRLQKILESGDIGKVEEIYREITGII